MLVVNTGDDSRADQCDATHCTLREAIVAANGLSEGAQIRFALPAFPHRIELRRALPALHHDVSLDGASQPEADCPLPVVHIDGSAIGSSRTRRSTGSKSAATATACAGWS